MADREAGDRTPLNLHRAIASDIARELRFVSSGLERGAVFKDRGLDEQTLRGVRELSTNSAIRLDQVINVTDALLPRDHNPLTVSRELLAKLLFNLSVVRLPEEIAESGSYDEGAVTRITVNRYERQPRCPHGMRWALRRGLSRLWR